MSKTSGRPRGTGQGYLSIYRGKVKTSWVGTWRIYDTFGRGMKRAKTLGDCSVMSEEEARRKLRELTIKNTRPKTLEARVKQWVETRIGDKHMASGERAMRLLEEAIELAQAEGITLDMVNRQADYVFSRPVGDSSQEAAGVAVCLLGWCAATGRTMLGLAQQELRRIEEKPISQIRGSVARKTDKDLIRFDRTLTEIPQETKKRNPKVPRKTLK